MATDLVGIDLRVLACRAKTGYHEINMDGSYEHPIGPLWGRCRRCRTWLHTLNDAHEYCRVFYRGQIEIWKNGRHESDEQPTQLP